MKIYTLKTVLFSILVLFLLGNEAFAQLPAIKYNTADYYIAGKQIAPISPVNTGGSVTGGYGTFAPFAAPNQTLYSIANDGSGKSFVISSGFNNVYTVSSSGASAVLPLNSNKNSANLKTIAVHSTGNLYVSDYDNGRINKYSPSGAFITAIGTNTLGNIYTPYGIAFDAKHNVYVADGQDGGLEQGAIFKIEEGTNNVTVFATGLTSPWGLAFDPSGNLYVSQTLTNSIVKITPDGSKSIITTALNAPRNLTADAAGNIFIADYGSNSLKELAADGSLSTLITGLTNPSGVVLDDAKNLYIANTADGTVVKSVPNTFYTLKGTLPAGLSFNTATGVISGTPTAVAPPDTLVVTAYNASGADSTTVVFDDNVHVTDLTGVKFGNGVLLTWVAVNEQNNTVFTIQRSVNNGADFNDLGVVNSASDGTYSFTDNNPVTTVNDQYRLKILGADSSINYSNIVIISNIAVGSNTVLIYPNPTIGPINLVINKVINDPQYEVKIISSRGVMIRRSNTTIASWKSDVSTLLPGIYIIQVIDTKNGSEAGRGKFIKL